MASRSVRLLPLIPQVGGSACLGYDLVEYLHVVSVVPDLTDSSEVLSDLVSDA